MNETNPEEIINLPQEIVERNWKQIEPFFDAEYDNLIKKENAEGLIEMQEYINSFVENLLKKSDVEIFLSPGERIFWNEGVGNSFYLEEDFLGPIASTSNGSGMGNVVWNKEAFLASLKAFLSKNAEQGNRDLAIF